MSTSSRGSALPIPFISTEQMREVDRLMVAEYGVLLLQMMENAGRSLATLARERFLGGDPRGSRVLALAGTGGNGGGGLACARWLSNWGAVVRVWTTGAAAQLGEAAAHQLRILERMGVPAEVVGERVDLSSADLVVDAIIGYSLLGDPRGPARTLIDAALGHGAPVLALDVPSGVDAGTGTVYSPAIKAAATMTLALPKEGLRATGAGRHVGEMYLADIGVPLGLYAEPSLGIAVGPIFAEREIVRVW